MAAMPMVLAVTSTLLSLGAAAPPTTGTPTTLRSGGLAVQLDATSGAYVVSIDGRAWLSGGATAITVGGAVLRQVAPPSKPTQGVDTWGAFEQVEMYWGGAAAGASRAAGAGRGAELVTSVRCYTRPGREMAVFAQRWPGGWRGAPAKPSRVVAPFPTFSTAAPPGAGSTLNFLQWGGCQLANSYGGRWTNASAPPGGGFDGKFGCQLGIPTLLYDRRGRGAVISPAGNWLTAVHEVGDHSVGIGVSAAVRELPVGFVHETMLLAGPSVNATMRGLGDALLQKSRKPRPDPYGDFVLSHLGYWTDSELPPQPPVARCVLPAAAAMLQRAIFKTVL